MLPEELLGLAGRPLLVLCDYDGTLAPIVPDPERAHPEPGAREALRALQGHARHELFVITGRATEAAHAFLELPDVRVIGLHGMAWPDEPAPEVDHAAMQAIREQLPRVEGLKLEDKRYTLAVHYRDVPAEEQARVVAQLEGAQLPQGWERVSGKMVREFRPAGFGKGRAARRLAQRYAQHTPVFLGDDVTDEEAFEDVNALGGVTVKIGEGETRARQRLRDPAEVVALLRRWAAQP